MVYSSTICAAVLGAAAVVSAQPSTPVWPKTFNVTFTETTSDIISNNTFTGAWAYDFANLRQRIDRSTGKYDRYCGTVKTDDSPCTHLVVGGVRYLWWPQLEYCCKCCTDAQGCGVVNPTWMVDSNGTYQGRGIVSTPVWVGVADSWEITGLQPNYWFQDLTSRPIELAQIPDDYQYFNPSTYTTTPLPDAWFTIPGYCFQQCPLLSICTLVAEDSTRRPLP